MALTPDQQSAQAQINYTLNQFGLGSLASVVWNWYLDGKPMNQIMLDMRQTTEYQQRFPAMADLAKKGMSISESDYISYERTVSGLFRAYGMPAGFYDQPADFAKFISGNVSVSEVEERLKLAAQAVYSSPPETRDALQRLYGLDQGHLTAYWLDPDKAFPLLQQQFSAGQLGGAAAVSGYGTLTRPDVEQLASRGITLDQAYKGFGTLAQDQQVLSALPGEQGYQGLTHAQQEGAVFGYDPNAALTLQSEQEKRVAAFKGGGQYAASQQGVVGLQSEQR